MRPIILIWNKLQDILLSEKNNMQKQRLQCTTSWSSKRIRCIYTHVGARTQTHTHTGWYICRLALGGHRKTSNWGCSLCRGNKGLGGRGAEEGSLFFVIHCFGHVQFITMCMYYLVKLTKNPNTVNTQQRILLYTVYSNDTFGGWRNNVSTLLKT